MANETSVIKNHEFDIQQETFSFLSYNSISGKYEWGYHNESISNLEQYWNEIDDYIPFSIKSPDQINGFISTNDDPIYILNIDDNQHLIHKNQLCEKAPKIFTDYFISKLSK